MSLLNGIVDVVVDLLFILVISAFALGTLYTAFRLIFHAWFTTKQTFDKD